MQHTEKKSRGSGFALLIWLAAGLITAAVGMLMYTSGSRNINQFYDGGKVYDVGIYERNANVLNMRYDAAEQRFVITEDAACKIVYLSGMEETWNYMRMELRSMNRESLEGTVVYYNKNGNVFSQPVLLREGENIIETDGISYSAVEIWLNNQKDAAFSIKKMQFREKMLSYSKAAAVAVFLTVFAVYTVLSYAVYRAANMRGIHVNWYGVIDGLQEVYLLVGEKTGWMAGKMSAACRGKIRTGLFLFLILYMQAVQNLQKYENDRYFKIQMLVCGLVVFLIGVLCFEGTLQKRSWRNKLAGGWTVLWIMACVSDFFVGKRYMFLGYLMLSAVGFFIFMWNNMKDEMMILREMNAAILISFAVTSVFCFLCRPLVPGYRYLGSYYNPGMYAMYVLYVWIALWADLDFKMNHKRKLFPAVLPDLFGIALAGLFIWKTQSSSGVIPAALTVGIFLFKQFFLSHSRKLRKKTGIVLAAGIVLAVPVCMAGQWGLTHLPEMLNTQVQFPNDALGAAEDIRLPFEPVTVYAAENAEDTKKAPEHHVLEKFTWNQSLEEFTTGRNLYWMGYLREMNLIGNENKVYLWGKNRWPHNGFIVIMFRYGVFAVIPYTLMVVMNLYYSWKYMLSHKKTYGFFVFASMAASLILILMENLELPFLFLCWIVMYLTMGVNFVQEET